MVYDVREERQAVSKHTRTSAMNDPERIAREEEACAIANNASTPPPGIYCPGTFDSWLCWPHARANSTVYRPCPVFVPGFSPESASDSSFFTPTCTPNRDYNLSYLHYSEGA